MRHHYIHHYTDSCQQLAFVIHVVVLHCVDTVLRILCPCVLGICVLYLPDDSLLARMKYSFSTRRPGGTAFKRLGAYARPKCRDTEAVLSMHPHMNQKTLGDEYFYGLLLHLPGGMKLSCYTHWTQLSKHCLSTRG